MENSGEAESEQSDIVLHRVNPPPFEMGLRSLFRDGALEMSLRVEAEGMESISLLSSHARSGHCVETMELFGRGSESLELYKQMQLANIAGNAVTIFSASSVCAELAALNLGQKVHGHVVRALMNHNLLVASSFVTMYMMWKALIGGA
ncbi:hypothetical protein NL676_006661 [Syzygium grande]|nr:hypothetical protein NL676_006661 [Syzygium grande]